jgi:YesN/AraC family two-component response regulator
MELLAQHNASGAGTNALCAALEEWIRGRCETRIRVADLAAYFGFNPDYLNRVFRRYHPEGLKAYIDFVRCQGIRRDLCSTDLSLQEISQKF